MINRFYNRTVVTISVVQFKCLEIFVLKGNANQIRDMTKLFQSNKKKDDVKLIAI
ncbi:MAG: hypothetical protein ACTHKP_00450 [Nitrososphaeraceae archaeon]